MSDELSPPDAVARCQIILSHAWMVRTFVKHSEVTEDFPELMGIVRSVFDTARSLESRVDDPKAYINQLRKKIGKLRAAAAKFRHDAPLASDHTNFKQAVISMDGCVAELEGILALFPPPAPPPMPRSFRPAALSGTLGSASEQADTDPTAETPE